MSDDEVEFWGKDWGPQNEILTKVSKKHNLKERYFSIFFFVGSDKHLR